MANIVKVIIWHKGGVQRTTYYDTPNPIQNLTMARMTVDADPDIIKYEIHLGEVQWALEDKGELKWVHHGQLT